MGTVWSEAGVISTDLLLQNGRAAAGVFAAEGIGPRESVALLLRNVPPFLEATIGAQHLGAYAVPINWHFTPAEIVTLMDDCGSRLLIAEADLLATVEGSLPDGVKVIVTTDGHANSHQQWSALVEATPPLDTPPAPPVQSMIYTSGTTGRPKGVRRDPPTPAQASASAALRRRLYATDTDMRCLLAAPLYHSAPNFFALGAVTGGADLILQARFDAEETLRTIERHRISHAFMVPTMFVRLLGLPADVRARYDVSSLRSVLHAGAPCSPAIKAAMIDWWGPVIHEYYGSTELGALTYCTASEWLERPGTVGRPLPGIALEIVDDEGAAVGAGTTGEICVTKTVQPDFTYHGDQAKRDAMNSPVGLRTGDIGYLDTGGYLFICDRRTDMVISGGVNIYPAEIEAALIQLPGVRDCAVLGIPDAEFGETVIAFVQTDGGVPVSSSTLLAGLRERLAGYKVPRRLILVEALPRDDSGKIFKRRLREAWLTGTFEGDNGGSGTSMTHARPNGTDAHTRPATVTS